MSFQQTPPSFLTLTGKEVCRKHQTVQQSHVSRATHNNNNNDNDDDNEYEEAPFSPLKIVGICGGIGCGKSLACSLLVSKINSSFQDPNDKDASSSSLLARAHHIDTDSLAHGVYAPKSVASKEIEIEFGKDVISDDGTVNRKALGSIVFADPEAMTKLEKIVWPHLKDLLLDRIAEIRSTYSKGDVESPIVVVEAAVLLDLNWDLDNLFDAVWVVAASVEASSRRLIVDRRMDRSDALKRIEAQYNRRGIGNLDEELRNGVVTAVIENNGSCEETLWQKLKDVLLNEKSWKSGRCPSHVIIESP